MVESFEKIPVKIFKTPHEGSLYAADEIAKLITNECGKTFEEAKAEMVRAYENIEVACGMPHMGKGEFVVK